MSEKGSKKSFTPGAAAAATAAGVRTLFANPVLPGNFPDPSIVRVGVLAQGPTSVTAAFERFTLTSQL